VSEKM